MHPLLSHSHRPSTKTMASSKLSFLLFVLVLGLLFLSHPVFSNDEEDDLFQGLNSFRKSANLPEFKMNDNAACLADELADELEDQPCSSAHYIIEPGNLPRFPSFEKLVKKCHININATTAAIIWPVCVPDLDEDLVLNNYTHSHSSKYLNDSKYSGVGIGSEDDWIVAVLTTDAESGSFSGGVASLGAIGMFQYTAAVLLGLFLVLVC